MFYPYKSLYRPRKMIHCQIKERKPEKVFIAYKMNTLGILKIKKPAYGRVFIVSA